MPKFLLACLLSLAPLRFAAAADAAFPPPVDPLALERQIHLLINRERASHGLPALQVDGHLGAIARNHSLDMAQRHFFNHVNRQGEFPADRARRQGWDKRKQIDPGTVATGVAENIFLARLYDKVYTTRQNGRIVKKEYEWTDPKRLVHTIVRGWLDSPHHRKVMLSPQYDRQGIGVAVSGYDIYVTENLF